jgi:hypothetical protein
VLIELAPNGSVAKVTLVDVKNTTNVIDAVSAFGVGAKTGAANFRRNLDKAIQTLLDPAASGAHASVAIRERAADMLATKTFDVAIATTKQAVIEKSLPALLARATGQTSLPPMRWIP